MDHPAQVQASDCSAPASRPGFSGELILLSVYFFRSHLSHSRGVGNFELKESSRLSMLRALPKAMRRLLKLFEKVSFNIPKLQRCGVNGKQRMRPNPTIERGIRSLKLQNGQQQTCPTRNRSCSYCALGEL